MTVLRSILVPIDGSGPSTSALEHALALAEDYDARVEILGVVPEASEHLYGSTREIERAVDDAMDRARTELGSRATCRVVTGNPLRAIVERASDGFDLIVMGTHGRIGRLHALLGSTAEGALRTRRARC
jgi:nucleotide-binding universal stress UspA family protein